MTDPTPATANDVLRMLGDVDPLIVERILATGASPDEIVEALRSVEDEIGFGEESHEPSSGRVAEIRALMWDVMAEEDDELER